MNCSENVLMKLILTLLETNKKSENNPKKKQAPLLFAYIL